MTLFSFVIADCDKVVTPEVRQRFFDSLLAQTFKDFELILCHDGARTQPIDIPDTLTVKEYHSEAQEKVGGDNLRTPGMKLASGEFIINGNIDNVYSPSFLEELAKVIANNPDIGIFIGKVKMMGMRSDGGLHYDNPRDYTTYTLLNGNPPRVCNIDIMNLVAAKDLFAETGYWWSISSTSDGEVYENLCNKYQYLVTDIRVGEHY